MILSSNVYIIVYKYKNNEYDERKKLIHILYKE